MIKYQVNNINFDVDFEPYVDWLKNVIKYHDFRVGDLMYVFCDDDYLIEVNRQFLKHDTYTDIITFPTSENESIISGQILISISRVTENAKKMGLPFEDEFARVLVHGVLHLMGYDDHTAEEKAEMRMQEDKSLSLRS
jgi:probable rRNA maturation factor